MANKPATASYAKNDEEKYRAEDDVRTLIAAKEIKADKARFKRAIACAREKYESMGDILSEGK